ncbi:MAG: PAS domain-containing protein, partial [Oscillospiraceae bacterium]|nr:PAS domain-containing protein [Oscillospiraceae bacterium]
MNKKTALLREVAEQNRALQTQLAELARERALIDAITGSMNEGLLLLDTEGRILSANHSIRALLNIGGDIAGKNVIEVVRHVELIQHIEAAKAGESSDAALTLTGKVYQCLFRPTPDG